MSFLTKRTISFIILLSMSSSVISGSDNLFHIHFSSAPLRLCGFLLLLFRRGQSAQSVSSVFHYNLSPCTLCPLWHSHNYETLRIFSLTDH